jgi:hypothetical protein
VSNEVFANGQEISCKKANGKSICAFPDVCFTPPENPATPPGVPIPYPNTGMAADTTDGSKTVKISGQEVMLKDKSYFKKSVGDEAGCATKKGVVTSTNRGKVYFNAWSMDVKFEGENVVRHLDLTTHNHASVPGNSPTWPYLDEMSGPAKLRACGKEMEAVKDNCPNCEKNSHTETDCPKIKSSKTKNSGYRNNPCVKAKRCMLVPKRRQKNKKGGCCPGQTGHHIVPKHHFKDFPGYSQGDAPCVCVEGHTWHRDDRSPFNQRDKTHPDMHDIQDANERLAIDIVEQAIVGGWQDVGNRKPDYAMSYDEARMGGIEAHKQSFPDCDPPCSEKCLEAQINAYHRQKSVGVRDSDLLHTKPTGAADDE